MVKTFAGVVALLLVTGFSLFGQSKPSIQGVWRVTESFRAPGETTQKQPTTNAQPGYYIFTPGHYSLTRVTGDTPRMPPKNADNPTLAEFREADRFVAQFGTYEVKGDLVTFRSRVVHNATVMASLGTNTNTPWTMKLEGKTLTLTRKNAEGLPSVIKMVKVE